ncbi:MAG TPA: DUF58 domain-containing protein [Chthoniobacterales bacterium]|jgi:uncharacterized protein (DUF58 family)|nr:DUF58 domain-containing protein [Chthoniobacterales bacterium]
MSARKLSFLLPTPISFALAFVLAAMWYAGASQANAANYLLLFATLSIFLVSIPHTVLNLGGLKVSVESINPAFAGQEVSVPVEIVNHSRSPRYSCVLTLPGHEGVPDAVDEIAPGKAARVTLRFPAAARGEYRVRRLRVTSSYPLGFLRARKESAAEQSYFVYPKPAGDPVLPSDLADVRNRGRETLPGEGDDFAGVRAYVAGESQRHIDWKAVARGQPLMTKQFTMETDDLLYLDYNQLRQSDTEERLSQLALWIVEAERLRRRYALRLPTVDIAASSGEAHYHRCLQALALFR